MRTPSGNCGLGMGGRSRARDFMALNRSGGRKMSPSRRHRRASIQHEQREFGGAAWLFSDLITPKEGRGIFCRPCFEASGTGSGSQNCIAAPKRAASLHDAANPCMQPQIEARERFSCRPRLCFRREQRSASKLSEEALMQRPASHPMRNLIQNRAVRPLICQHCDGIFSAPNFAAHFNTTHRPCAAKVLRAAPQCRCDQSTLSMRGSDESSASR